jgi:hypothetical protein
MPSVRTKAVGTRIPKDLYWVLLRQAAERKMTMSLYLQELLSNIVDVEQKVEQKENGGLTKDYQTVEVVRLKFPPNRGMSPFKDRYIVVYGSRWFEVFPNDKVFAHNIVKKPNGLMQFDDIAIFQAKDGKYYHGVDGFTEINNTHFPLPIETTKELLKINWFK